MLQALPNCHVLQNFSTWQNGTLHKQTQKYCWEFFWYGSRKLVNIVNKMLSKNVLPPGCPMFNLKSNSHVTTRPHIDVGIVQYDMLDIVCVYFVFLSAVIFLANVMLFAIFRYILNSFNVDYFFTCCFLAVINYR